MSSSGSQVKIPDAILAKGHPSPQIAQLKRTWYFLSRNTLALIGLGIMLFFIGVAGYSVFYHAPNDSLVLYCGTYGGPGNPNACTNVSGGIPVICTYPNNDPTQAKPNCYPVDPLNPSLVPPTVNVAHLSGGPLPLGSLSTGGSNYFYNIYAGLVKGAPWSLGIAAAIVASGALIGLGLGALAGYAGGYIDESIMRVTDIFLSIPAILLVLVTLAVFAPAFHTLTLRIGILLLAFIVTWWPFYTRIVRGQVLVTREQKYVEASKASGARTGRILTKHIIPNSLYPVFVQMSLDVGGIPLLLGAIVFLGYPVFPSLYFPEWGSVSALAVRVIQSQFTLCGADALLGQSCTFPWWQLLFPGLTVFLFAIAVNFLSDGLRDALDPRLRR